MLSKSLVALLLCLPVLSHATPWQDRHDEPHPISQQWRGPVGFLSGVVGVIVALNVAPHNDKLAHCVAGAGLSLSIGTFLQPIDGFVFSIGVAGLKEYSDDIADMDDLAVTVGCGAVPYLLMETWR